MTQLNYHICIIWPSWLMVIKRWRWWWSHGMAKNDHTRPVTQEQMRGNGYTITPLLRVYNFVRWKKKLFSRGIFSLPNTINKYTQVKHATSQSNGNKLENYLLHYLKRCGGVCFFCILCCPNGYIRKFRPVMSRSKHLNVVIHNWGHYMENVL